MNNFNNGPKTNFSQEELKELQEKRAKEAKELIIYEKKEKLKRNSRWYLGLGIFCLLEVLVGMFSLSTSNLIAYILTLLFFIFLTVSFFLLYKDARNKIKAFESTNQKTTKVPLASANNINNTNERNSINEQIDSLKKQFQHNLKLTNQLDNLESNLKTTEEYNIQIPKYILTNLDNILKDSSKIAGINTIDITPLENDLTVGIGTVNEALSNIISKKVNVNFMEIEANLEALQSKLTIDGYTNDSSDFNLD